MRALHAAGLTPISVLDRRTEPRKNSSLPTNCSSIFPNYATFGAIPPNLSERLSKRIRGGLVLLSSVIGNGFAGALTYEEALQRFPGTSASGGTYDFDVGGLFDSVLRFGVENPAVVAGAAAALGVPLVLFQILKPSRPWGVESAKTAYAKLAEDASSQLLDIRPPSEFRQVGSPDVGGLKKKPVSVVYKGEDKRGFLKKLALKFKEPENITLFVLDKFGGNSELVAELVTANGFKAAYAIRDGAEGPRGWLNSGLPWVPPKTTSLDFGSLSDAISNTFGEISDSFPVTAGIAAAAGFGLLAFTEVETILQLLGSAALIQFASKRLLFAEDRKKTLQQFDEFLNTKIAPQELVGEVKEIGMAFLPSAVNSKALPASSESSSEPAVRNSNNIQTAEAITQSNTNASAANAVPVINSVPKTEVKEEPLSGLSRPLSPYPHYPDLRPPTSPAPSQP